MRAKKKPCFRMTEWLTKTKKEIIPYLKQTQHQNQLLCKNYFMIYHDLESISLSKPYRASNELTYLKESLDSGHVSSLGVFAQKCESWFEQHLSCSRALMTHSCTAALEMVALLIETQPGDEIILPSFTFVSTANAFALRGASLKFADSLPNHPNVDPASIISLISSKTKAIVVVHYAGMAVDMDSLLVICREKNIFLIKDAAQGMYSHYKNRPVGTIGDFATFSFHETKPISCGEGGMLIINRPEYIPLAEKILEKGTNKIEFKRGGVQSYEWNCLGSSFAASQLQAAVLLAQLEEVDMIFEIRKSKWQIYDRELKIENSSFRLPQSSDFSSYNTSVFYLEILKPSLRNILIRKFNEKGIQASFHYKCLHTCPFGKQWNKEELPNAKYWEENIIRLPLHTDLSDLEVVKIIGILNEFISESE